MGSIRREDKLGALQHSGGSITLGPSTLTIGAKQFVTTSTLNVSVGTRSAFELVYVYATLDGNGDPQLELSANVNSVGPGTNTWKLVGAFYANSSGAFASFVTIEGTPTSGLMSELTDWQAATPPIKGGNIADDYVQFQRRGKMIWVHFTYKQQTAGTAGSGVLNLGLPITGVTMDNPSGGFSGMPIIGFGSYNNSGGNTDPQFPLSVVLESQLNRVKFYDNESNSNAQSTIFSSNFVVFSGHFEAPITQWDETPLKDL